MKSNKILIAVLIGGLFAAVFNHELSAEQLTRERLDRHEQRITLPLTGKRPQFDINPILLKSGGTADILISETASPAAFDQRFASITRLSADRMVFVWQDNRFGSYKIFGRMYDSSGNVLTSNQLLVGRSDGFDLIEPQAAADGTGGFYLVWRDITGGRIYAARYDVSLTQTLAPYVINSVPEQNYAGPFDIASFGETRLAVAWEDYGVGNNIMLRIFNASGTPLTDPLQINTDATSAAHWVPSVAFDETGRMGVVWEDYRFDNGDIFFQLVNGDGSFSGPNLGVIEGTFDDSAQFMPEVAYSDRDGFAISWLDRRDGIQNVYRQRFVPESGLVGGNMMVSSGDSSITAWDISMTVDDSDNLRLVWTSCSEIDTVKIQKFTNDFLPDGSASAVNRFDSGARWQTALGAIVSGKMLCGWTDFRAGNGDIYMQLLSAAGTPLFAEDHIVNDDAAGAASVEPDMAILGDGRVAVVFTDSRSDAGDIYLQLVSAAGSPIGGNEKVNDDATVALQNEPAMDISSVKGMIVWNDGRAVAGVTGQRIFGRFITAGGVFDGDDFLVSDSMNVDIKRCPMVGVAEDGNAFAAWVDYRNGTGDIFGRHFNPDGSPSGSIFQISSPGVDIDNDDVSVNVDIAGNFTVSWLSLGAAGGPTVVASRYSIGGAFLNRFTYPGDVGNVEIKDIAAAVNTAGDLYLVWEGLGTERRLYMTVLSGGGTILVPGSIRFSAVSDSPFEPDVDIDGDGNIITAWLSNGSFERQLFYQIMDNSLVSDGAHILSATFTEFMKSPALAVLNSTAWFSWVDPRNNGLNIYANYVDYISTDIEDDGRGRLPIAFDLHQNYPNPFNPETRIAFNIPVRSRVNISVFNMLGQNVAVLADEVYDVGEHAVVWSGTDESGYKVSSGVYLYKMTVGDLVISKKMLLVK